MTINKVLSHWIEVGEGQENLMLESMSYSTKTEGGKILFLFHRIHNHLSDITAGRGAFHYATETAVLKCDQHKMLLRSLYPSSTLCPARGILARNLGF